MNVRDAGGRVRGGAGGHGGRNPVGGTRGHLPIPGQSARPALRPPRRGRAAHVAPHARGRQLLGGQYPPARGRGCDDGCAHPGTARLPAGRAARGSRAALFRGSRRRDLRRPGGPLYLYTHDTDAADVAGTAVPMDEIYRSYGPDPGRARGDHRGHLPQWRNHRWPPCRGRSRGDQALPRGAGRTGAGSRC